MKNKDLNFKMSKEELDKFLEIVKEIVKISEDFKILFLEKGILVYGVKTDKENPTKIEAMRIYDIPYGKIFKNIGEVDNLSLTMMKGKTFYQKMLMIMDSNQEEFDTTITHNNGTAYNISAKNEILSVRANCQSSAKIRDFGYSLLEEKLNSDFSEISFQMTDEQLVKVLKMSKLDKDNKHIEIRIEDGVVFFSENDWDLEIFKLEDKTINTKYLIQKTFLTNIDNSEDKDSFELSIFPSYIVINETKSYYMFSLDLTD